MASFLNEYYSVIDNLPENPNMAVICISLNEKLIRKDGIYAPRFFTGFADVTVKFDEDYVPEVINYKLEDGEFYEHDYVTDYVYPNLDASDEDMKTLERYIAEKIDEVVYGKR
jgi:hypothetical protein